MTLAEQTYHRVRWDIVSGSLPPEQPLRLEGLKARYGVGFSPIREALSRLQAERLVVNAALRGFTVAPISLTDMWDAIETRILIECDALCRAMLRGGDAWEAQIVAAFHTLSLKAGRAESLPRPLDEADLRDLESAHHAFHHALIAACGSAWLLDFSDKLYFDCERYRFPELRHATAYHDRDIENEHRNLMQATLSRSTETAPSLLARHYRDTGLRIAQILS